MDGQTTQATTTPVNPDVWEEAYLRFETPAEEIRKFITRLRRLGADHWQRDARIIDLFCGRGNGLHALHRLGFFNIEGVDLSPTLASQYEGPGAVHVADCRDLPFADNSKDIAIVQGGLHHLPTLPDDLEKTLLQVHRVLRPGGRFIAVEPWLTPFLSIVHMVTHRSFVRRLSGKCDALAIMIEHERKTYEQWLSRPTSILGLMKTHFDSEICDCAWGKLMFVGVKREAADQRR